MRANIDLEISANFMQEHFSSQMEFGGQPTPISLVSDCIQEKQASILSRAKESMKDQIAEVGLKPVQPQDLAA